MEKVFLLRGDLYIRIAIIYGLVFAPIFLNSNECGQCPVCQEEVVEGADYELFEEFEKAFERFEIESEQEVKTKGFIGKWCKKLKKWFAKKIFKIFKKMAGIKKIKTREDCAYTIAKFKRKMDKKFSKQISIDEMFEKFDRHSENLPYSEVINFKERIKFYHKNKHEKPPQHHQDSFDEHSKDVENVSGKVLAGGVGIFCGTIIAVIPLPGCYTLGSYIIDTGVGLIVSAYIDTYFEEPKKEEPNK